MLNSTVEICGPPALEGLYVQGVTTQLQIINYVILKLISVIVTFIEVTLTKYPYEWLSFFFFLMINSLIVARHSTPSSTTCLPSSSPCQRPTDWPVSETTWCFSFTSTRDGTHKHQHHTVTNKTHPVVY